MFKEKKTSLFDRGPVSKGNNTFLQTAAKSAQKTHSLNGAEKYKSTGDDFVDQFGKLAMYKAERSFKDISHDAHTLYVQNARLSVMFILFLRLISRVVSFWGGNKTSVVQKGGGLKHEAIMRMIWLHTYQPSTFWKNIQLFIACGSWKDIFEMLRYDLIYNGWEGRVLNWNEFGGLIAAGLENPNTSELVKKYLPQIKSRNNSITVQMQANTMIGKFVANTLKLEYYQYRKLKSSGKAHEWQQLISKQLFEKINFDSVHGRALLLMVSGKFLQNQNLEDKYEQWIANKPIARFTGYVHELGMKISNNLKKYQKDTIDKQYLGLVELAKNNVNCKSGLIVVRDTSSSMSILIPGQQKISSGHVAKALSIFFSDMLEGPFKNAWIEFHSTATLRFFKGKTFTDKWLLDTANYYGSTNFMSVAAVLVKSLKNGALEQDFPTGILCISDSEFNPAALSKTNVESFKDLLKEGGFSKQFCDKFQIILWNVAAKNIPLKFETFGNVENVMYLSGYDTSILGFLLGTETNKNEKLPTTARELFDAAMNQEVLNLVEV